jgi:aquaporin Z
MLKDTKSPPLRVEEGMMRKMVNEFLGTFFLVLTIVCAGTMSPDSAPIAVGGVLACWIYVGSHVSGAHYNPAVSFAMMLSQQLGFLTFVLFAAVQFLGAAAAAHLSKILLEDDSTGSGGGLIGKDHSVYGAGIAEVVFSGLLCFVALSTTLVKSDKPNGLSNSYYGAAIGFSVTVGIYAAGPVSGGVFNPAAAVALMVSKGEYGAMIHAVYAAGPLVGAAVASLAFRFTNPKEFEAVTEVTTGVNWAAIYSEFIGTFYLALTLSCVTQLNKDDAPAAIGMVVAILTYASKHVSTSHGAHFNPAVSFAMAVRGRLTFVKCLGYICVQCVAAFVAGSVSMLILEDAHVGHPAVPVDKSLLAAALSEVLFSFALCYVVMSVTTVHENDVNQFHGLAIGLIITVGAYAAGPVAGAAFNPAVASGLGVIAAQTVAIPHGTPVYVLGPFVGGIVAALFFRMTNPAAYKAKPAYHEKQGLLGGLMGHMPGHRTQSHV